MERPRKAPAAAAPDVTADDETAAKAGVPSIVWILLVVVAVGIAYVMLRSRA
jgi:hypothetical protein